MCVVIKSCNKFLLEKVMSKDFRNVRKIKSSKGSGTVVSKYEQKGK